MVGRDVQLQVDKQPAHPGETVLDVENVTIPTTTSARRMW